MSVHLMNLEAGGETILVTFARHGSEAQAFLPMVNGAVSRFTPAGRGNRGASAT